MNLVGEQQVLKVGASLAADIAETLGVDDFAGWVGHAVELYPDKIKIDRDTPQEKTVDTIRARPAPSTKAPTSLPPAAYRARNTP